MIHLFRGENSIYIYWITGFYVLSHSTHTHTHQSVVLLSTCFVWRQRKRKKESLSCKTACVALCGKVKGHHLEQLTHAILRRFRCSLNTSHQTLLRAVFLPSLLSYQDQSVCARTFCGAGRECVSTDRGEPVCRCLQVSLPE